MPQRASISTEIISNMAAEILGIPLAAADVAATAGMLNALLSDMQALHNLAVSAEEPATTYAAVEGQP